MSLALFSLSLFDARPAQAQGGWNVTDADNHPLPLVGNGYSLVGTATGAAKNHYPKEMTDAATAPRYYDPTYGWVDNSQWLQAASGGPHSYDPNPLGTPYLYTGGATSPPSTSIALNATAHNYAFNNEEYGSFNKGDPPFFLNQMHKNLSDCEPINGDVTGRANGTLWAYWNWMGSGAPPDHLDILLTTNVSASSSFDGNAAGQGGLSAIATASDGDPFNETATSDAGVPWVVGRHLLRVPVSGGVAAVSLNGNVSVSAINQIPYGGLRGQFYGAMTGPTGAKSIGSVSATASIDYREVTISSPTIEDSYYKGTYDSQHGSDRYLHQRNTDGSIQTDSVAFYSTADNNHGWNASANFVANTPGFTSPTYSWSSDFNPVAMLGVDTTQPTITGGWFFGSADNLPKSSTVTLNVQDADGTTASNTFGIKWHLPYEAPNPAPYLVFAGKYSLQPARVGPVSDGQTTLVQPTKPQHFDWEATINGASVVAKVGGQEEIAGGLEIVEAITKVAKPYTDVDAEPVQETGATNGPTTWSDALSENQEIYTGGNVPSNLTGDPNGWQICKMYIFQVVHYKDKYWYADGYKSHGYDGTSQNVVYLRNIDSVYDEFQFIQYKNHDGSPYNPS